MKPERNNRPKRRDFDKKVVDEIQNGKFEEKKPEDKSYKVKISIKNLNIRKGPGTNYAKTGRFTGPGEFKIVDTQPGVGSDKGWGRLERGGWISLMFCEVLK